MFQNIQKRSVEMLLRLLALLSAIVLTIGSAMQQANFDKNSENQKARQQFIVSK
jgi:hypothetical protein